MSWTCPNRKADESCGLQKKKCEPGSDGCVMAKKFKFIGEETKPEHETKGTEPESQDE